MNSPGQLAVPTKTGTVLDLVRDGRVVVTLLLWIVFAINLSAFYLLQSWLPTLLTGLHRPIDEVATATSLSTVGGIAAAFVVGPAMDSSGSLPLPGDAVCGWRPWRGAARPVPAGANVGTERGELFAGFCISGSQKSAIALATLFYPPAMRSAGLGWALEVAAPAASPGRSSRDCCLVPAGLRHGYLVGWQ